MTYIYLVEIESNKMLSDIQSNEIKHKYDQGYRICDLSKEYNVSWGTIKNTLHR